MAPSSDPSADSSSSPTSYDRYEMIRERLNTTQQERKTLKLTLDALDLKIKNIILHIKKRPRETDEELVQRLHDLEFYHSTHPQTNKDEREFMRELSRIKNKRKDLAEFNEKQAEVDELKSQRSEAQRELKEKEMCLDELYDISRAMRAAHKLGVDATSLCHETVTIPSKKIGQIVGLQGSNIKKMEDECFVCMDMDRGRGEEENGKLQIFFTPDRNNIDEVKRRLQFIIDTKSEEQTLTVDKITCLLIKKASIVMKIQEMYNVRVDISKSKLLCKVTGLNADVDKAMAAINSLETASTTVDLVDRRTILYLLGKGRERFRDLLEEYSVDIDLDKNASPPTAKVVGAKNNVVAVTKILREVVSENKEVEDEMSFDRHVVLDAIIGKKGVLISQMQRDFSVKLTVDKEKSDSGQTSIKVIGNAASVNAVKQHINERVASYLSETVTLPISQELLPGFLGKKGSRIMGLRQKYPAVNIEIAQNNDSIHVHSNDPVQRLAASDEIEKYIASNARGDFNMNKSSTITLKGPKGADTRKYLRDTLQLNIDIDTEGEVIRLQGRDCDIEQGKHCLATFCEENFEAEVPCNREDIASFTVKDLSPLQVVNERFKVECFVSRKKSALILVGDHKKVIEAKTFLEEFLAGDCDISVMVSIPSSSIGAFVGRGGSHVKSFEDKHNVKVDILKSREQVRIFGSDATDVKAAKTNLLCFLDGINTRTSIENCDKLWSERCDSLDISLDELLNKAASLYCVDVSQKDNKETGEKTVSFWGITRRVNAAKKYVTEEISGKGTANFPLMKIHQERLSTEENLQKLIKSVAEVGFTASLGEGYVCLSGPLSALSKAKIRVNRLLDFLFTGEFSSIVADVKTLLMLWNFETELDFESKVFGAKMYVDMRMSCVRVCASTSISHTLGVEYVRNAISECKKRIVEIPVSSDVYSFLIFKKAEVFGHIEKQLKCKVLNFMGKSTSSDDDSASASPVIVIEGPSEKQASDASEYMRGVLSRLEKENWKTVIKGDIAGALIGRGGSNIKQLRNSTKANINVDLATCTVEVNGKEEQVKMAKEQILKFVEEKMQNSHLTYIPVTPDCIPKIVGSKGVVIRDIRSSSKAVSIDIDRNENVVIVKGSLASGQAARQKIVDLLLESNIDISRLHYETPEERKRKAEEKKAEEKQKQALAKKEAEKPKASSREDYLDLLNQPGISKSAIRRIKRKLREGVNEDTKETLGEQDEALSEEREVNGNGRIEPTIDASVQLDERSNESTTPEMESLMVSECRPETTSAEDSSRRITSVGERPAVEIAKPSPVLSHQQSKQSSRPRGTAGSLLSMILGNTPVNGTASQTSSYPLGSGLGVETRKAKGINSDGSNSTSTKQASISNSGTSYYKSKTGRTIRLD